MLKIDATDRAILRTLQADATVSLDSIAEDIGVSLNTAWRRVQRLEKEGIIKQRVAVLNPEALGFGLTVFVAVRTNDHSKDWADRFAAAVNDIPEIVEFYRLAGDVDYLLKVMAGNVQDYDTIYQRLISRVSLSDVSASFAMETLKSTTELPLK